MFIFPSYLHVISAYINKREFLMTSTLKYHNIVDHVDDDLKDLMYFVR